MAVVVGVAALVLLEQMVLREQVVLVAAQVKRITTKGMV
tara:strand:- start:351 stop:467 length:117 start_codon:yes stop_codon:yes gene_type:complete